MRIALLLFATALAAAAQAPAPPKPVEIRFEIARAKRPLSGHVKEILSRVPEFKDKERSLEIDELVDPRREVEWGAEGGWHEVVLSLAKAASLEVEDSWTQWVKLVPAPSKLLAIRVENDILTGFRRETGPSGEAAIRPVVVLPPWYEAGGWSTEDLTAVHDPAAPGAPEAPVNLGAGWKVPASATSVHAAWGIEIYLRTTMESVPLEAKARFKAPGGGTVTISGVDKKTGRLANGEQGELTVVRWISSDVQTAEVFLVLEDGTVVQPCGGEGNGMTHGGRTSWNYTTEFEAKGGQPKELRFRVVHEAARVTPGRTLERKELDAPRAADLIAGPIHWTRPPAEDAEVVVGAVRADGWGARTARIELHHSDETGALEGRQDNTGWERPILLTKSPGEDLRYRVFGLDAGDWIVWIKAGNWIELRRISAPGRSADGDAVIAPNHSSTLFVLADGEGDATLVPLDEKNRPFDLDGALTLSLERQEDGTWAASGIRPGDYFLKCGRAERGIKLAEGINKVDLR